MSVLLVFKTITYGTDSAIIESEKGEKYHVIREKISDLNWLTITHNKNQYNLVVSYGFYKLKEEKCGTG